MSLKKKKDKKGLIIAIVIAVLVIIAIAVAVVFIKKAPQEELKSESKSGLYYTPEGTTAVMKTTVGDISLKFYPKEAPKAVYNFVELSKKGYYDNVIFHRVWDGFMIQGGDPKGTGKGGQSIYGAGFEVEPNEKLRHYRGMLSMANTGQPNSNGSQFFIVQSKPEQLNEKGFETNKLMPFPDDIKEEYRKRGGYPTLDGGYTVFGEVTAGMDVVDKIAEAPVNESHFPDDPVTILSIAIKTP